MKTQYVKQLRFLVLVLAVVIIGLLHFITPGNLLFYHDTYRRLSYFPIALAGLWFGVQGGLAIAVLSSIAFIPHLILYAGQHPAMYLGEFTEIVLYLAAGTLIGAIAGKEARLRGRYQQLSQKLEKSYDRLHEQTELLLEVEEQLGASQRLSALGQLSASLAHEIKNPLSSIRGTAEILLDEFPPGHPKREFVEILRKETDRLNNTVENVLQYSRGQQQTGEAAEPLGEVLRRVGRLLDGQLRRKSVKFRLEEDARAGETLVDGGRLSQVFLNLILNAIEAVEPGGVIAIRERRGPAGVAVSVCDSGPGIPAAEQERVFLPFVSGREGGTGLGLAISRKIVESYSGSIEISDAAEGGACFTVLLPEKGLREPSWEELAAEVPEEGKHG